MPKTTTSLQTPLRAQMDRLASFEPTPFPVLSLYLNLQTNSEGRGQHDAFLRKVFAERGQAFAAGSNERKSYEADTERIHEYLGANVRASANGLALFASEGAGLFEAIQVDVPMDEHWFFIGSVPHLYPLARLNDQYPRYAAAVVDTRSARLFVFSMGTAEARRDLNSAKTRRTAVGGWSQARFQRHVDQIRAQHIKEVVDLLDRVVREESINHIVVSCDDVTKPMFFEELPKHLAEKVVDLVPMEAHASDHEVLTATLEALREKDGETDAERVDAMLGAWKAGGLGTAGPERTLEALQLEQVEELLITASPSALRPAKKLPYGVKLDDVTVQSTASIADPERLKLADELVSRAQKQSARIRFIEDAALLEPVGGCGAILRFKI